MSSVDATPPRWCVVISGSGEPIVCLSSREAAEGFIDRARRNPGTSATAVHAASWRAVDVMPVVDGPGVLAWIGRDELHDAVGIRSIGTPFGVIPACLVANPGAAEKLASAGMVDNMQAVANYLGEAQRLVLCAVVDVVREVVPGGRVQ